MEIPSIPLHTHCLVDFLKVNGKRDGLKQLLSLAP